MGIIFNSYYSNFRFYFNHNINIPFYTICLATNSNPFIFSTWWCKLFILITLTIWSTTSGCKDKGIRKSEFVARTHFYCSRHSSGFSPIEQRPFQYCSFCYAPPPLLSILAFVITSPYILRNHCHIDRKITINWLKTNFLYRNVS